MQLDLHSVKTGFLSTEVNLKMAYISDIYLNAARLANFLGLGLVFEGRVKREACFEESVLFRRYFSIAILFIFKNVFGFFDI